jgi:hypothetical protein
LFTVNFDAKALPNDDRKLPKPAYAVRPFIHRYGKLGKMQWKAELDVVRFVRANALLIQGSRA